jgi:hypothetical protein
VVFDEAHHSPAKSWRDILKLAGDTTGDAVLGFTATPTRISEGESQELIRLYGGGPTKADRRRAFIHEALIDDLIERRILARPVPHSIDTRVDLMTEMRPEDEKFLLDLKQLSPRLIKQLETHAHRNRLIIDTWKAGPAADGETFGRTIVFAVNVPHAEVLREGFAAEGIGAEVVHTYRSAVDNRAALQTFRDGEVQVLLNVAMLTEGVDVPGVDAVFLTRPTSSMSLFNQMVGRGLRGPAVGGTEEAHIVDFHDLWGDFPDWRVGYSDLELQAAPTVPDGGSRGPTSIVPGLLEAAIEAARLYQQHQLGSIEHRITAVPLGVYRFALETTDPEAESTTVEHALMVFEHDQPGYARIAGRLTDDIAGLRRETNWEEAFFADLPVPRPSTQALHHFRRYALEAGTLPVFHRFDERDAIDPERVAQRLLEQDLPFGAVQEAIDAVVAQHPALVERVWGDATAYAEDVTGVLTRLSRGEPARPLIERVPAIVVPERRPLHFGLGIHDLRSLLEVVAADRQLFPGGIDLPDEIVWTKDERGAWGLYLPGPPSRIVINTELDTDETDERVLTFLIYHELLHHEQWLEGRPFGHGRDFKAREAQHPDRVESDAFLDTFRERFQGR